jgi:hypothetical protein
VQNNPTPLQRSGDTYNDPLPLGCHRPQRDSNAVPVIFRQGNSRAEAGELPSFTAGIAVSAPFYRDLTVTVDYWRIDQKDVIDDVTTTQLIRDEELLDGAVQKALAAGTRDWSDQPRQRHRCLRRQSQGETRCGHAGRPRGLQHATMPVARRPSSGLRSARCARSSPTTSTSRAAKCRGSTSASSSGSPTRFGQGTMRGDAATCSSRTPRTTPGRQGEQHQPRRPHALPRQHRPTWRKDRWMAGWFTTYYGTYVDTGTATTQEIYEALGKPEYISVYVDSGGVRRYRYLVSAYAVHNAYLNYALPRKKGSLLSEVSIRLGVSNAFDNEPPLADEDVGYRRGAGTSAKGRTWYSQVSKRF